MAVITYEITSRAPFAQGQSFGDVGPYEQLDGTVHFAVDPTHPDNATITDIGYAPRDAHGLVRFAADCRILRPVAPQRGTRRLLLDVLNRGRPLALRFFNSAPDVVDPSAPLPPGNGFLMRQGYTVVWCGWQYDVPAVAGLMRLTVPDAVGPAGPIAGKIAVTFQPNALIHVQGLSDRLHRPYPTHNLDDPDAVLTVHDHEDAPGQIIPRQQWAFARLEGGRVVPNAASIYMASGFLPGKGYRVVYSTTGAPVVGLGMLATRDITAFLRYGSVAEGNPCSGEVQYAYGFGASQSGRLLRHLLYLGLNQDEHDRPVFDGLMPHIAGGRRGEFNQRFGQPSSTTKYSTASLFPFSDVVQTDPETGQTDGVLARLAACGKVPKILFTNTSVEYWGGHAALTHTDITGTRDLEPSPSVRIYHYSGTQHGPGTLPLTDTNPLDGSRGQYPFNSVDYRPLLRATLVRLDRWVSANEPPPASTHPCLAATTAVPPPRLAATFQAIPGVSFPTYSRHLSRLDFGPDIEHGIITTLPPTTGKPYPVLVAAVDEDGNELGGIRLPDLSVPLATYTGWNLRHADLGGTGQTLGLFGATLPFPTTRTEREAAGDPRRSIEERYASKEAYLGQVRLAAERLVDAGYVLVEDLETLLVQAAARYDLFASQVRAPQAAAD